MLKIDLCASQKFQPLLSSDETIYWAGMPNPQKIFHTDDLAAIPVSLAWTAFFIFWESQAVSSGSIFMSLWGIPFLIVGNYLVWARFFVDAWLKRRTYYAVTNRRILILQEGWRAKTAAMYVNSIPIIESEGTDLGTLWFGPKLPVIGPKGSRTRAISRFSMGDVPVFADIDEVTSVQRLIISLRDKSSPNSQRYQPLTYPDNSRD